jgi:hypothetical protein
VHNFYNLLFCQVFEIWWCSKGFKHYLKSEQSMEGRRSMGTPWIERFMFFKVRHPEMAPWITELIDTYITCQGLPNDTDDLEVMYRHIFGDEAMGQKPCSWCKAMLEREIEHQKQWIVSA